jgi:hypothetical protein
MVYEYCPLFITPASEPGRKRVGRIGINDFRDPPVCEYYDASDSADSGCVSSVAVFKPVMCARQILDGKCPRGLSCRSAIPYLPPYYSKAAKELLAESLRQCYLVRSPQSAERNTVETAPAGKSFLCRRYTVSYPGNEIVPGIKLGVVDGETCAQLIADGVCPRKLPAPKELLPPEVTPEIIELFDLIS